MTNNRLLILLIVLLCGLGTDAQDWAVADSLAPVVDDTTDYEVPVQRHFNALEYSLDTYHRFQGDRFEKPLDYLAFGGGRMTINDNKIYNPAAIYMMHLNYGRQFDDLRSLRLSFGGGVGLIQRHSSNELYRTTNGYFFLETDYLYSVSSYLLGYRPERTLDVSAFIGAGVGYSRRFESESELLSHQLSNQRLTGRLRGGLQLKFYAGPQAAVAIEPYAYISTRAIDLVRPEYEFYSYRMGGGVDISYIYYLRNRLTVEGNEGTFQKRFTRQQRHLAGDVTSALLRHPLVVGVQGGTAAISGHGRSYGQSLGPSWTVNLGWWLSPMLGIRGQVGVDDVNMNLGGKGKAAHYIRGAFDLMLNPLASVRRADWHSVAGMALVAGYEGGRFYEGAERFPGFGYHGGVNLWTRITDGIALTLEPQYAMLTHNGFGNHPITNRLMRFRLGVDLWLGTGAIGSHAASYPLGSAGIAVGRGVAAAGVAVGRGVATAGVAVGRGVATAGTAVGRGVAAAGVAVAHGVAAASVATGRSVTNAVSAVCDQDSRPFFLEYALGWHRIADMPTDGIDTWEPEIQVGAGWWPLAAVGVRAGTDFLRGSSHERTLTAANGSFTRYDKLRLSFVYADVLVNPLGFRRHYNWQSAAGVNLVVGRLVGNLANANVEERYWKGGWRLGGQLWARVDDGLRFHVEPLFTLGECEPQSDNPQDYTYKPHRNIFSLKVGLTMLMPTHRQRSYAPDSLGQRWFVGAGGGVHFNKDSYRLSGSGTNTNLQLMAGYRLTRHSAIRWSEELTFDHFIDPCSYRLTSGADAGKYRRGYGKATYRFLFSSLAYQYDLLGLFHEHPSRRWEFNALGGFAVSYYLNETTTIPGETEQYEVSHGKRVSKANFNVLVGLSVGYRLSPCLSAYFNHHLYMYSFGRPQWLHYSNQIRTYSGNINTFNAGLMYHF